MNDYYRHRNDLFEKVLHGPEKIILIAAAVLIASVLIYISVKDRRQKRVQRSLQTLPENTFHKL